MQGCITFLIIILLIALLIKFPFFIMGIAVILYGLSTYQKNKKENVKSKVGPTILIIGILLTLGSCASSFADDETDKENISEEETSDVEESPVKIKEEPENKPETDVEKEEEIEVAQKQEEVIEPKNEPAVQPVEKTSTHDAIDTSGTTAHIPVTLLRTIDGDTIKIRYEGREINVRYLLIDTPETNHPRLGKQPFGEEAKERNRQLVNSGKLTIEFDVGERVDKYGRLLAYVYVDGKSVQQTLLSEGLARVAYIYPPNTRHLTPYEEAQGYAKRNKLGIWSIENYATDSGFNGSVSSSKPASTNTNTTTTKPAATGNQSHSQTTEWYQNCTELRKVHPNGVPKGHPAYQAKMDRDKDNYACER